MSSKERVVARLEVAGEAAEGEAKAGEHGDHTVSYGAYNTQGLPTQITDTFGQVIALEYDDAGQLVERAERGVTQTWAYDAIGRPTEVDYGTGATVEYESTR